MCGSQLTFNLMYFWKASNLEQSIQLLDIGNTSDCHLWKHFRLSSIFGRRTWAVSAKRLVMEWHLTVTCLWDNCEIESGSVDIYISWLWHLLPIIKRESTWEVVPTANFLFLVQTRNIKASSKYSSTILDKPSICSKFFTAYRWGFEVAHLRFHSYCWKS